MLVSRCQHVGTHRRMAFTFRLCEKCTHAVFMSYGFDHGSPQAQKAEKCVGGPWVGVVAQTGQQVQPQSGASMAQLLDVTHESLGHRKSMWIVLTHQLQTLRYW
jgi:hypothetical protein